jgi:hypothetical protein
MGIYAALKIPEVWRYKGKKLRVYLLGAEGAFRESPVSLAFPHLDMAKVNEFLQAAGTMDETTLLREFAAWVRKKVLPRVEAPGPRNGKRNGA